MLETIWFVLWALLWAVYFILDGFDLGLGALLPFLGKNESERRIMYNAAGPFWDGNEVWLISAGGVTWHSFRWKERQCCKNPVFSPSATHRRRCCR